jgi:hypothetical protein
MKMNFHTMKQQTQDFLLRLFVESGSRTTLSDDRYYTCSRCGTYERLHQ